jgi:hypothetical protein
MLFLDTNTDMMKLNKFWNQSSRSINKKCSNNKNNKLNETTQNKTNNYFEKIDKEIKNLKNNYNESKENYNRCPRSTSKNRTN